MELTRDFVLSLFEYDKENGKLKRKSRNKNHIYANTHHSGYVYRYVNGKCYGEHRLIFLIENNYLPKIIDHIDGNRANNVIGNLRESSNRLNCGNRWYHRNGDKPLGCFFNKKLKKWQSRIKKNYKHIHLGLFNTKEEAQNRYLQELNKYKKEIK